MTWEAWLVGGLLIAVLGLLASGRFASDTVMLGGLLILMLTGIVTPTQAMSGFSNAGVITVALLYVVATGLQETGAMTMISRPLLGHPKTALQAQARLILPVAGLSAFVNNTPVVAMFMPVLSELSRRTGISASRLFMPLSFAAILGGVCTLIGTSTNLVVHSQILDANQRIEAQNKADPEHAKPLLPEFGMWTIAPVGLPVAVAGIGYILLMGRRLLRAQSARSLDLETARQYATAMRVAPDSIVSGRTVEQAGLRHLPGLFLSRIERENESVAAVGPEEVLQAGDVLVFVGVLDSVVDLQKMKGLVPVIDDGAPKRDRPNLKLIEAVISPSSPLVGQTIREAEIRTRYGAVVIAVHRHGERVAGKIGDIVLRPGDTLLLEAEPGFARRHRDSHEFHLLSELEGSAAPRHERAWISLGILVVLIVLLSLEQYFSSVTVAMTAAGLMVLCRCCTGAQARAGIDWSVLLTIAASLGIGRAMETSGLASNVASAVLSVGGSAGPIGLLAAVYVLTLVFTTFISNNAAAAIMFPIAVALAESAGLNVMPLAVCIAVAASCEFLTPLGYQTNLMVMGPGGYRWLDYTRFGGPLTLIAAVVAIVVSSFAYGPLIVK